MAGYGIAFFICITLLSFIIYFSKINTNKLYIPALTPAEVASLIESGAIHGGMVPKVRSALRALDAGVPKVRITDLSGLCVEGGTCFQTV